MLWLAAAAGSIATSRAEPSPAGKLADDQNWLSLVDEPSEPGLAMAQLGHDLIRQCAGSLCHLFFDSGKLSGTNEAQIRFSILLFLAHSNAHPTLFEMAQREVQQRRDRHRRLNADVASCARNRACIPDLIHRRNDERKAQHRCRQSGRA